MKPRLLVANRGEIAIRIVRACRDLGLEPVVVFSDADRTALHVRLADVAIPIGPAPARESYLVPEKLLSAARDSGCTYIHPGFGFLSENAAFAQAVIDAGFVWVGPRPSSIEAMGSKTTSRARMLAAGVPIVPGMTTPAPGPDEIVAFGRAHGFPLLLKASAGGGGKGMRIVRSEDEIPQAFERARSEARSFFADEAVYAELYVEDSRHIEVQVLGDSTGRVVALGERECSLQRRHQKVLEECPSAAVTPAIRAAMQDVAVTAARAVDYMSAGTVEFLLAKDGRFFFLEMNTRIQVEHPVTEMVFGVDLVTEMISIAMGRPLSCENAEARGHAIECRIYAEDPSRGFAPSPGKILRLRWPGGPGVRVDAGVEAGDVVPLDYDPMLAKVIAWGEDRDQALSRMRRALTETRIEGIETSVPFFLELLADPDVIANRISTQFLDGWRYESVRGDRELEDLALVAAALAEGEAARRSRGTQGVPGGPSPSRSAPSTWRDARESYGRRG